jgi:hypothetical protein
MIMQRTLVIAALALGIATPALAQQKTDLPNSGTIKFHLGYKSSVDATQVADKHSFNAGTSWGVTYNDAGSGPLHMGTVVCKFVNEAIEGAGTFHGKCAWSESDSDRIFTEGNGKFAPTTGLVGSGPITGGSGRFNGIQGKNSYQCKALNAMGQGVCSVQFDYELVATGSTAPPSTAPSK